MANASIGSVSIDVVPDATNFLRTLEAKLRPGAKRIGQQLGDDIAGDLSDSIGRGVREGLAKGGATARTSGSKSGEEYGGAFARNMKTRLEAAFRSLPHADLGVNSSAAEQKIAEVRSTLLGLTDKSISTNVSGGDSLAIIKNLKRELDDLGRSSPDIKVRVDAAAASSELAAIQAQVTALDTQKVTVNSSGAGGFSLLGTAIATIGPALIPLGAAAAAAAGAFGLLGAAGVAAFFGIKSEMASASAVGEAYSAQVDILGGNLDQLKKTAASGMLAPFTQAVTDVQGLMPGLNSQIGDFSGQLGRIGGNVLRGLIAGFQTLDPLFQSIGGSAERLSAKFAAFSSGAGLQKFGDYAMSVLPEVGQVLGEIGRAAVHLMDALSGFGLGALTGLRLVAELINAIPIEVLRVAAPLVLAFYLAVQAKGLMSSAVAGMENFAGSLGSVAAKAEASSGSVGLIGGAASKASGAVSGISKVLGVVGGVLPIVGVGFALLTSALASSDAAAKKHEADLKKLGAALAQGGAAAAAAAPDFDKLKKTVLDASRELDKQTAAVKKNGATYGGGLAALDAYNKKQSASKDLSTVLTQKAKDEKAALDKLSTSLGLSTSQAEKNAAKFGVTTGAYLTAASAAQKAKDKIAGQTLQMQLAGDAAGLLTQALDILNGGALGVAQSTTAFNSALVTNTTQIGQNGGALTGNTAAVYANQASIQSLIVQAGQQAEAVAKQTGSTEAGTAAFAANRQSIIDNYTAARGGSQSARDEITKYVDSLAGVPKVVKTQVEIDTAAAMAAAEAYKAYVSSLPAQPAQFWAASGGLITGPGSGTSDSIPTMLSNGEYVVKSEVTQKYLPMLEALNRGQSVLPASPVAAVAMPTASTRRGGDTKFYISGVTDPVAIGHSIARRQLALGSV